MCIRLIPVKSKEKTEQGVHRLHRYLSQIDQIYAYTVYLPIRIENEDFSVIPLLKQKATQTFLEKKKVDKSVTDRRGSSIEDHEKYYGK